MTPHRYQQDALALPGAEAREYSPQPLELAPPVQGHLALDGGALGPLFNQPSTLRQREDMEVDLET